MITDLADISSTLAGINVHAAQRAAESEIAEGLII